MTIKLADGLPYHDTLVHPRTGNRLRAICLSKSGKPVWPVIGASEDDTPDDKGDDKSDDDKPEDDKGSEKPKEETPEAKRIRELEAEIERVKEHRSKADKNKAAAEKELEKLKNKDLSELELVKNELEKAREDGVKSGKAFRTLAVTNAFLTASQKASIQWHDPEVAQKAAEIGSDIEVDDDGNVSGMDKIVKQLAKDKKFLVNTGNANDDKEEEEKPKIKKGPSGSGVGSGNNGGTGKEELGKDDLVKRFPALRK